MQEDFDLKKMIEMVQTSFHDQIAAVREDAARARQDVDAVLELLDDTSARAKEKDTDRIERLEKAVRSLTRIEKERQELRFYINKLYVRIGSVAVDSFFALTTLFAAVSTIHRHGDPTEHIKNCRQVITDLQKWDQELLNITDDKGLDKFREKWIQNSEKRRKEIYKTNS